MVIAYVPTVFAIAGALIYGFAAGKLGEVGRLLFFAGVLALAFAFGSVGLRLHA